MASRIAARSTTAGHAGEILQQHAAGSESNFLVGFDLAIPSRQRANIFFFTLRPSSVRSRFSSRIRSEYGRCLVEIPCLSSESIR